MERLREGFGYDEIAREEKLTERRVRQIVTETPEGREALEKVHARMQVERIGQAVRVAGEALARGEIRAVAPFIKAVETLDRFQSLAGEAGRLERTKPNILIIKVVNLHSRRRPRVYRNSSPGTGVFPRPARFSKRFAFSMFPR